MRPRVVGQVLNDLEQDFATASCRPMLAVTWAGHALAPLPPRAGPHLARPGPPPADRHRRRRVLQHRLPRPPRRLAHSRSAVPAQVFFCHYSPIDTDAGFRAEGYGPPRDREVGGERDMSATGTEDLLLDGDIVEAAARCRPSSRDGKPPADAAEIERAVSAPPSAGGTHAGRLRPGGRADVPRGRQPSERGRRTHRLPAASLPARPRPAGGDDRGLGGPRQPAPRRTVAPPPGSR